MPIRYVYLLYGDARMSTTVTGRLYFIGGFRDCFSSCFTKRETEYQETYYQEDGYQIV